jgi:glutamate-1-semialdehyde 2,1-aminomutase
MTATGISVERLGALRDRELERFDELRPRATRLLQDAAAWLPNGVPMTWMASVYDHPPVIVAEGHGASFTDVDGNTYLDFNLADTSMFGGYGDERVARAVGDRVAAGAQFLLPTEDAAIVAQELGRRFGLPRWQFTLSATQANVEALRVARTLTGRRAVVMFDGKYHGHADELIAQRRDSAVVPEGLGVPVDATRHVRIVPYNDLDAVEAELRRGDVACVLAEAAITNAGVIMPADGLHAGLRRLTREAGAVLVIDETHTLTAGPGGLTERWRLEPDVVVMGKSIASGIPLGAYGMTETAAAVLTHTPGAEFRDEIATGGTLFSNPVSMAAARVTLTEVLTPADYEHAATLGEQLADGIEVVARRHDLPWRAHRLFNRSGYTHAPELPSNAAEAHARFDPTLFNLQRAYFANRGVWEAIDTAGPACSTRAADEDVERYLELLDAFLDEVCATAGP